MKYHLIALFTVFVWGFTFISTKILLVDLSPLQILLLRFAIGLLALCAIRPRILKAESARDEVLFIGAGLTGIAAYYLLENIALVFTTATAVGVIVAASPLITALLQATQGDRSSLHTRFFLGFLLAMCGLVLVGLGSEHAIGAARTEQALEVTSLFGDILALLAAIVWALYSILVKKIADRGYETIAATKRTFVWGLVFIIPLTLLFGGPFPALETIIEPVELANLLFLGAIASAACFVTWGVSVKHLGATTSTTYIYLVPAITATASIIILGEPLTPTILCGIAFTILGLVISQPRLRKP